MREPAKRVLHQLTLSEGVMGATWRKYQFNIIDAIPAISSEWRLMLKGRDLRIERYYSQQNIEALRKIYPEKIYPKLWTDTAATLKRS
jgi:hypothetical protein